MSGHRRIKLAFYVGLFMGLFVRGRVYTGDLFPGVGDILGMYIGVTIEPLIWGGAFAMVAWLTTLVWP